MSRTPVTPLAMKKRKRDLASAGHPVAEERVDVHVPQAGDQELARAVDRARAVGEPRCAPSRRPTVMRSPSTTTVMAGAAGPPAVSMTVTLVMARGAAGAADSRAASRAETAGDIDQPK